MPEDIEELEFNDLEDDVEDESQISFWTERQKELVTAQVDYNLSTIRDLADDNTIDLKPHFQRRFRWDNGKKSKLIESLLLNIPVPPIYLNEDKYGRYSVIDGKQRISAIHEFFNDKFKLEGLKVFADLNGKKFSNLPNQIKPILRTRPTLRAIIVLRQSDPAIKYEVFQRLNTGGVALNPQEIRNNVFAGPFNNLINGLAESAKFHKSLRIVNKENSSIYREMRDSEFVLRFFTLSESWKDFSGGIRWHMDSYMDQNRNPKKSFIDAQKIKFEKALNNVTIVWGENAFKRWQPEKNTWRNQVLAALFDAQMLGLKDFEAESLISSRNKIISNFKALFDDEDFLKAVNLATNTPSSLKLRVSRLRDVVEDTIAK